MEIEKILKDRPEQIAKSWKLGWKVYGIYKSYFFFSNRGLEFEIANEGRALFKNAVPGSFTLDYPSSWIVITDEQEARRDAILDIMNEVTSW